jgi:hypothetical protein
MKARLLSIGGSIYWSDQRDEISYDGDIWLPHAFVVKNIKTGPVKNTTASVIAHDKNKVLAALSGSTGLTGTIAQVRFVKYNLGIWSEDTEYSQIQLPIIGCSGEYPNVVLELSASSGWRRTGGLPEGDKTCLHVLSGLRCKYSGPDLDCARDREHCRLVKNNLVNYGGFHFGVDAGTVIDLPTPYVVPGSGTGGRMQPGYIGGDNGVDEDPPGSRWRHPPRHDPPGGSTPRTGG